MKSNCVLQSLPQRTAVQVYHFIRSTYREQEPNLNARIRAKKLLLYSEQNSQTISLKVVVKTDTNMDFEDNCGNVPKMDRDHDNLAYSRDCDNFVKL